MFHYFLVKQLDGFMRVVRAVSRGAVLEIFPIASVAPIDPVEGNRMVCNGITGHVAYNGRLFPRPLKSE